MTEPKADQGNIVWIDDAKGNNNNDGLSQDTPVQSIDKALELAGEDGHHYGVRCSYDQR